MASVSREFSGFKGLEGAGAAVKGIFSGEQREINKAVREAQAQAAKDAAPKIAEAHAALAAARASQAAAAVTAQADRIVEAINNPVVETAAKSSRLGRALTYIPRKSASFGLWVAEQPVAIALKPVKWGWNGLISSVEKAPKTALGLGAAAAAVGVGSFIANRGSHRLAAQSDAIQQIQMAQAMQAQEAASQPAYESYKNSASYADVQAKIDADRAAGVAPGSQQAALAQRTPITDTATANLAAL